ncbi:MAG: DUF4270 family protein [Niabella sp.]
MKQLGICAFILLGIFCSCQKTEIVFQDSKVTDDPNVTYWDNYAVSLSTYKTDTFATTSDSVFVIGTHSDPYFGKLNTESYTEIVRPTENPFRDQDVVFDSAAIVLIPNGHYYGDTTLPFKINVYKLTEKLSADTATSETYYNPSKTAYDNSTVVASYNSLVKPTKQDTVFVKITSDLGEDLFNQLKNNTSVVKNQNAFRTYLNGLAFTSDSTSNDAVYQFMSGPSGGLIRIYYRLNGLYSEKKYFDLTYYAAKQYNHLGFDYSGSSLSAFSPLTTKLVAASEMDNKALLSNYVPTYVKVEFPDILNIKDTYPYIKVLQAVLEIRVNKTLNDYPYFIPDNLMMYISNQRNQFSSYLLTSDGSSVQAGSLSVNDLVSNGTKYYFDITSYINTIIDEGVYSTKALFLSPYSNSYYSQTSRLVVDNSDTTDPDIRLKLYVLGL